jgi:hypothetical protein
METIIRRPRHQQTPVIPNEAGDLLPRPALENGSLAAARDDGRRWPAGLHGNATNANGRVSPAVRGPHHRMDQNW